MPYVIQHAGHGKYRVINGTSKKVHAYSTTLDKAKKQIRLLNGLANGSLPKPNKHKKRHRL